MNLNQITEQLIELFPEQKKRLKGCIEFNNGEFLGHIYFVDEFTVYLEDLLNKYTETENIKKYCDFIEYMWINGDESVKNIVDVSILERISYHNDIWIKFGKNISNEFKEYINGELIPNNIMMKNVNKL